MFEKFTERARKVMSLARQESQRLNGEFIGTEHILLAIIAEGGGVAAKVLKEFQVDAARVKQEVEKLVTPSTSPTVTLGQLPFSPRAKRVIELAGEESGRIHLETIGTGQLLIGLVREAEGIAAQVMQTLGVKMDRLRRTVEDFERMTQKSGTAAAIPSVPSEAKTGKMIMRIYSKVKSEFHDSRVLVINGDTYLQTSEIGISGIDVTKRREVAQAIAKEHGSSVYVVEKVEVIDEGPSAQQIQDD